MWSEVFTNDSRKSDELAIVLLDDQGIFDDKTSIKDCTTIFAISTMISSVQSYNIMRDIQEDDLQQLEFFTEYDRLARTRSIEKPYQKLLFVVRDWPHAFEINYGDGRKVIDETKTEQTSDMRQLRKRIKSSFEDIDAFSLPYPGGKKWNKFSNWNCLIVEMFESKWNGCWRMFLVCWWYAANWARISKICLRIGRITVIPETSYCKKHQWPEDSSSWSGSIFWNMFENMFKHIQWETMFDELFFSYKNTFIFIWIKACK